MNEHDEYLRERQDSAGPVTLREFVRDLNVWLIVAIVGCVSFWAWVGYCVARWLP